MSDAGIYAGMDAEIVSAVKGASIPGVLDVNGTLSLEDLLARDGIRRQGVGVIDAGAKAIAPPNVGQKQIRTAVLWEIAIVIQNDRGGVKGRAALRVIQEGLRDALNGLRSSAPGGCKYRWRSDEPHVLSDLTLCGAVSTFEIETYFGN